MTVGQDLVLMFGGHTSSQAGGERAGRRIRLELSDVEEIRDIGSPGGSHLAGDDDGRHDGGPRIPLRTPPWCAACARPTDASATMTMGSGRWIEPDDEIAEAAA